MYTKNIMINKIRLSLSIIIITIILFFISTEFYARIAFGGLSIEQEDATECIEGSQQAYFDGSECYGTFPSIAQMLFSSKLGYVAQRGLDRLPDYVTNLLGQRDRRDPLRTKGEGRTNIFVTGGSTAWAAGVRQRDTYARAMEEALGETYAAFASGIGGQILANEIDYFTDVLTQGQPDIWISLTGWNDVYSALFKGRYYYNSPDMLGLGEFIYRTNDKRGSMAYMAASPQAAGASEVFWRSIYPVYTLKSLWLIDKILATTDSREFNIENLTPPGTGTIELGQFIDYQKMLLKTASSVARHYGVCFIVALQPSLYATAKPLSAYEANFVRRTGPSPGINGTLQEVFKAAYPLMRAAFAELAEKEGFIFIDTDKYLADKAGTLFVDHVHFGSIGNQVLGAGLARDLEETIANCPSNSRR